MRPHNASRKHQLRSSTARLVRLAAVACLALAVAGSAAVWAQPVGVVTTGHRCIHDQIQQRVLQSVAQEHDNLGTLSAVGLPSVASAPDLDSVSGTVDFALPYTTGPDVTRSKDWGELRITVSTDNFTDTERYCTQDGQSINDKNGDVKCSEDDILTEEKRDILINSILPEAVRLHTDRLKVRQVQSNWTVAVGNGKICGVFNAPQTHLTNGVNNTDFLLYVVSLTTDRGAVSWGATCQVFPDGQPAVGVINVPAAQIVSRYDQRVIRTVAHQIAHALGFSEDFFQNAGITKVVENIRSKPDNFTVINGSKTVEKARTHYNCSTLEYVEIDNRSNLDWDNSHLSMRNAKDELMAPEVGAGYYTALTMAIFEDTRFYKADFSKAEAMTWGRNAGCDFLNNTCMKNNITQWPQMFCDGSQVSLRCPSDRLGVGMCGIATAEKPLSSYFQYFTNGSISGSSPAMDYCPFVEQFNESSCNQNSSHATENANLFNVFSDAARCIDGAFTPKNRSTDSRPISGMCANVQCDNATNTYSVQVKGSRSYVNCTEGQKITLDNISDAFEAGGYITCPPYAEVCQGNVKAAMDFKADLEKNRGTSSSSGRGHIPTDSMPSSGSGANKPNATSSNGKGDRLYPRGNGAAGLHSARTLVSAGVALLVVTLTVGLSA